MRRKKRYAYHVSYIFERGFDRGHGARAIGSRRSILTHKEIEKMERFLRQENGYSNVVIINIVKIGK